MHTQTLLSFLSTLTCSFAKPCRQFFAASALALALSACVSTPKQALIDEVPLSFASNSIHVLETALMCRAVDKKSLDQGHSILPVAFNESIWPRIQNGLSLPFIEHKSVKAQLNWYVRHPEYFKRVQRRASRYLYFITERLHDKNIPFDLALLPIVESAYEPFAYSHGQASGLWQFIPGTAKRFKMQSNWWIDERRDVVKSTEGALNYLQYLYRYFDNDWMLAVAAYNSGEGTVRRAIRKNKKLGKPTDFWHLKLPKETSAYVPKLIALSELFRHPEKYNLELVDIPNKAYFDTVTLDEQIDLSQAADLSGISLDELYLLNSGLNRWATPPKNPYQLKLPVANTSTFIKNLNALPDTQRVSWHYYKVRSGDNLIKIAQRFNTDVASIKACNNLKGSSIRSGQTLMIATAKSPQNHYKLSQDARFTKRKNFKPKNGLIKQSYRVQPSDTFWAIAKRYDVDIKALAKWNNKAPKDALLVGETLVIWSKNNIPQANERIRKITYTVRNGDSLAKVANKFNTSIRKIASWNKLNTKKYLQPGQRLTLYVNILETY